MVALITIAQEAIGIFALGVRQLKAGNQGQLMQDIVLVFTVEIDVDGVLRTLGRSGASVTSDVSETVVVGSATGRIQTQDENIPAAEQIVFVGVTDVHAEIVGNLVENLEDGVEKILVRPEAADVDALLVVPAPGGGITEPQQPKIAFLLASQAAGIGLGRIFFQLRLGQASREVGLGIDIRHVEPGFQVFAEAITEIGENPLVLLFAPLAKPLVKKVPEM